MKIEWLNPERTEAIVTKGWFRKKQARVRRISYEEWMKQSGSVWWWRFVPSDALADFSSTMESRRDEAGREQDWQPVQPLPAVRVVRR